MKSLCSYKLKIYTDPGQNSVHDSEQMDVYHWLFKIQWLPGSFISAPTPTAQAHMENEATRLSIVRRKMNDVKTVLHLTDPRMLLYEGNIIL